MDHKSMFCSNKFSLMVFMFRSKGRRILRLILSLHVTFQSTLLTAAVIFCLFCFSTQSQSNLFMFRVCLCSVWCLYLSLSGLMFSRLSSFKKLLLLACFERGCLWGCSLMSSYLTMDTSHEKLETNSEEKNKEPTYRPLSGRRLKREERVLHLLFFVLLSWTSNWLKIE